MDITWTNYLWDSGKEANLENVKSLEAEYNIKYPNDYLDIAIIHQGKVPTPDQIKVGKGITGAGVLFLFDHGEDYPGSTIRNNISYIEDDFPEGIIPFMGTGGGGVFAFDFRNNKENPIIVFIDPDIEGEEGLIYMSENFKGFLEMLRDDLT